MHFLYDNLAVFYIALVTALMAWLYGGMRHDSLVATVPWLMLFMAEVMMFFPQKHEGEPSVEARERAWKAMKRDPLVWTAVGFLALLAIPFVNNGLCPDCDAALIAQGLKADPPVGFLPFCVNRVNHLNVCLWFVVALSCMVATKHCLTRHGKRRLLEMIVWNGMALAVFGFVQIAMKAPGPLWWKVDVDHYLLTFFSTWGYVNTAGDYFTTLFCISIGLWRWRYDEAGERFALAHGDKPRELFWKQNLYLVPAGLFFYAAANTMSRAAIMLITVLAVVFFVHTFLSFVARIGKVAKVKATAISAVVLGVMYFSVVTFMPAGAKKEMSTVDSTAVLERVTGKNQGHAGVAMSIWKEHFLFGCGGWGYQHLCMTKLKDNMSIGTVGAANVHNDSLQFLAEHGAVGFGALAAMVIMLLRPIFKKWRILIKSAQFSTDARKLPRPIQIFVLPAPVFCFLMALVATLIHSLGDCPLRSASVMSLFFVLLASLDGFMPAIDLREADNEEKLRRSSHHHHHHHHHHTDNEEDHAAR